MLSRTSFIEGDRQFTGKQTYSERLSYLPKVTQSGRAEIGLWVGFVSPIFMAATTFTFFPPKRCDFGVMCMV